MANVYLITNQEPFNLTIKDQSNITNRFSNLQDCLNEVSLDENSVIITSNYDDAIYCETNKIPCIYYAGNRYLTDYKYVYQIKSDYKGITCTANCNRNYCSEKQYLNIDYQPCQVIEKVNEDDIAYAIKKVANIEIYHYCKYCKQMTNMHLSDNQHIYICNECNGKNIIDVDSYIQILDRNIGRIGSEFGASLFTEPDLIYFIDKRLEYLDLQKLQRKKVLVFADDYGTITYWLLSNGIDADYYETNEYYKDIAFTLFGIESIDKIEWNKYDVIIVGNYDRHTIELPLNIDYIIFIPEDNGLTAVNKLNANYVYELNEQVLPANKFGKIVDIAIPINNNFVLHLAELVRDVYERKYFVASSIKLKANQKETLIEKSNNVIKKYFVFHNIFAEKQFEVINEGNNKRVLLTDHFELVRNYIEYFKEYGYTIGVIHKDKKLDLQALTKEINDFKPNFFFSGFFPDVFLSKDYNGNWNYTIANEYFFENFDFPIIMRKVDHPFVVHDFLPSMLKIIKKYNHKFAIIVNDSFVAELYKQLGVNNVYSLPSFNLIAKSFDYTCKTNKPLTNKKIYNILFPGAISNVHHEKVLQYLNNVANIVELIDEPSIKNNFFNKKFFMEADAIFKAARKIVVEELKAKYKVKTTENMFIPYCRLKYMINASKITFYMHSQGYTVFHDMALDPFLYDSLALTDYKPEIKVWLRNYYKDVTYTSINDLFTKLDYYLTNDKIRNDLIQSIKEYLLNNVYNKEWLIELIEDIYSKLTNKQKNNQ